MGESGGESREYGVGSREELLITLTNHAKNGLSLNGSIGKKIIFYPSYLQISIYSHRRFFDALLKHTKVLQAAY